MLAILRCIAIGTSLAGALHAQVQVERSFERIPGPIRDAGVYHLATGTWTRRATEAPSPTELVGATMDTIYSCTSASGYYQAAGPGWVFTASGRIPSTTSPDQLWNSAASPAGSQLGSARGCADTYQVEGFTIGYCTAQTGPTVQMSVAFYAAWPTPCTTPLVGTTPTGGPFALSGLPGRGTSSLGCWVFTIDLAATTSSFAMAADGDGSYSSGSDDGFGWSFSFPSLTSTLVRSGPIIAGSPSDASGPGSACQPAHPTQGWPAFPPLVSTEAAGYDGRRFDQLSSACTPRHPANASSFAYPGLPNANREAGSDMLGDDAYRLEAAVGVLPGCRNFGGPVSGPPPNGPYANFHLELHAKVDCAPAFPAVVEYCGGGSVPTLCPCLNFGALGNGCASSFNPFGAHIGAAGTSATNVHLDGTGMQSSGVCVFLKGDTIAPNGFVFGDGVTCTGGALIRLRSVALGVTLPNGAQFPVPPETITLAERGGNTIGSGQIATYTVFYRNAAPTFCTPLTFNAANSVRITW